MGKEPEPNFFIYKTDKNLELNPVYKQLIQQGS